MTDGGRTNLIALQIIFEHHDLSSTAKDAINHHLFYRFLRGRHIQRDNRPFTGGIAISFHHDWRTMRFR